MQSKNLTLFLLLILLAAFPLRSSAAGPLWLQGQTGLGQPQPDPYYPFIPWQVPIKHIRIAIHVFQHSTGRESFRDLPADRQFLQSTVEMLNYLLSSMPPLQPDHSTDITSPYISDSRIRVVLDTIYFHVDDKVHEIFSQRGLVRHGAAYAHRHYVVENQQLNYVQKFNTLHIIISGNHPVSGGQVSGIGNRDFMLFKGWYHAFASGEPYANYGNMAHELGHSLGLVHHYGPNHCRQCRDLGCYPLGVTNNIMALYPSNWQSLSECQLGIMHRFLDGQQGNISSVVIGNEPVATPLR